MSNLAMLTPPTFRTATQADAEAVADVYLASRKQLVSFAPLAHSDEDIQMRKSYQYVRLLELSVETATGRLSVDVQVQATAEFL